jgi:hypothetical protein
LQGGEARQGLDLVHPCASAAGFGYRFWRHRGGCGRCVPIWIGSDGPSVHHTKSQKLIPSSPAGCTMVDAFDVVKKSVREIARIPWFLASRVCVFRRPRWPVLVCPARFPSLAGPCWSLSPPHKDDRNAWGHLKCRISVSGPVSSQKSPAIDAIEVQLQPKDSLQTTRTEKCRIVSDLGSCRQVHLRNLHV